jgi:hypothetical protein
MAEERKVKGITLVTLVELVRNNKDHPWDEYLSEEDMEIVDTLFIPSEWYPIEFSQRLVTAFVKIFLKGDTSGVEGLGRYVLDEMLQSPYKKFILADDPYVAIKKLTDLQNKNLNFTSITVERTGEKGLVLRVLELGDTDENFDYFVIFLGTQLKELAAKNGAKNIDLQSSKKQDGGETMLEMNLPGSKKPPIHRLPIL